MPVLIGLILCLFVWFLPHFLGQGSQLQHLGSLSPSSSLSPCSEAQVTQFIRQFVASCLLVSDTNTELSYVLPSEAVKKGCFERLFQVPLNSRGPFITHFLHLRFTAFLRFCRRLFLFFCVTRFSKALEHSLDHLALTSFGVMDTTLEEVFLKVSEEDHSLENSDAGETMVLKRLLLLFFFVW